MAFENKVFYKIDVADRISYGVEKSSELFAYMTVEQAWGNISSSDVVYAFEDRGGELIPHDFLFRDVQALERC